MRKKSINQDFKNLKAIQEILDLILSIQKKFKKTRELMEEEIDPSKENQAEECKHLEP